MKAHDWNKDKNTGHEIFVHQHQPGYLEDFMADQNHPGRDQPTEISHLLIPCPQSNLRTFNVVQALLALFLRGFH